MSTVVIVGAGVTGLLTAIGCARAGHRVTVLDRGPIPNPGSTSFDQHRALRMLDPDDADNTRRMAQARRQWLELETLLGTRFFRPVGIVTAWPRDDLDPVTGSAAAAGLSVAVVEPRTLPHLTFPPDSAGVLEHEAGVLLADRVLRAATTWLAAHPAVTLRPRCAVAGVDTDRTAVTLADGAELDADLVVIAAGPWSRDLAELPVVLHRQTMVYLRPPEDLLTWWENAPGVGRLGSDGRAWTLPPGDGAVLKISTDAACREVPTMDSVDEGPWATRVLDAAILPDVDSYAVVAVKECHYTTAADTGGPLLARVGHAVWSRAACGGNGFSTAPLVADEIVKSMMEAKV
jgi:glycine/D-amino acid oxidase-like deaminating enzyme